MVNKWCIIKRQGVSLNSRAFFSFSSFTAHNVTPLYAVVIVRNIHGFTQIRLSYLITNQRRSSSSAISDVMNHARNFHCRHDIHWSSDIFFRLSHLCIKIRSCHFCCYRVFAVSFPTFFLKLFTMRRECLSMKYKFNYHLDSRPSFCICWYFHVRSDTLNIDMQVNFTLKNEKIPFEPTILFRSFFSRGPVSTDFNLICSLPALRVLKACKEESPMREKQISWLWAKQIYGRWNWLWM